MPLALYALAVATFAIGTTEFVIVGLLPGISADLTVSIATAGLLVSLYALSITVGTPVLSALAGGIPRRRLAIALMTVFTVCNLSAAVASTYSTLVLSRIVMAIAHGVFFAIGAACATSLVSKLRAGSAVAVMMGGLAGYALRIDRDGDDCATDRDSRAPPAGGKRRFECCVNLGSIRC